MPTWDLRLPDDAPHYRDSSPGAITAAGMLRVAKLAGQAQGSQYRREAQRLLDSLAVHCSETKPQALGLLRDGTYNANKGWGVEACFVCSDSFFVEALLALEGKAADFWGPGTDTP